MSRALQGLGFVDHGKALLENISVQNADPLKRAQGKYLLV
jgi:hypothetical protein